MSIKSWFNKKMEENRNTVRFDPKKLQKQIDRDMSLDGSLAEMRAMVEEMKAVEAAKKGGGSGPKP